jgi:hypothetical protein
MSIDPTATPGTSPIVPSNLLPLVPARLLTPKETSKRLGGITTETLSAWRTTRRVVLPWIKISHRVFYDERDVVDFIAANRQVPELRAQKPHRAVKPRKRGRPRKATSTSTAA